MDLPRKFTEVNASEQNGVFYSFDNDFVAALMDMEVILAVQIVMQVERYVDNNYKTPLNRVTELAGVIKGKEPFFFLVDLWHYDSMLFERLYQIDSDSYLDYYNKNTVLVK